VAQGGVDLGPRRSQELRGSPELQNGGLRALEDAWMTISRLRHFPVKSGRFLCFWSVQVAQGGRSGSQEVPGAQGKPRAPERWPESFGRCLDDDFPIQAFSCQVWSLSVLLERPGRPGRCQAGSQKVPGDQGKPRPPEWWPENGRFPDRRPKRSREAPDGRVLDASGLANLIFQAIST